MASLTMTDYDAFLKEFYGQKKIDFLASMVSPFFSRVKKTEVTGDAYVVPVEYGFPTGGAHNISKAITNKNPAQRKKFTVTTVNFYDEIEIDGKVLKTSANDMGAFARARQREMDAAMKGIGKKLARYIWRTKGGALAKLLTDPGAGVVLNLTSPSDAHFFSINELVSAASLEDGGAARTGTVTVTKIARGAATNQITVSAAPDADWAINDFLFVDGDQDNSCSGVSSWIPAAAPSATLFFGVNRTVEEEALAGWRINTPNNPIWDQCLTLAERVVESGGEPASMVIYLHNRKFSDLIKELSGKTTYRDNSDGRVGKRSILVDTSAGSIEVTADPFVPFDRFYVLDMDTWEVIHTGGFPHIVDDDERMSIRSTTADSLLVRMRAYYQVVCWAPIRNAVGQL
jgi:hypothetical protein